MFQLVNAQERAQVDELVSEIRRTTSEVVESRMGTEIGADKAHEVMQRVNELVDRDLSEPEILRELQGTLDTPTLIPVIAVAVLAATQTSCVHLERSLRERF